IVLEISGRYRDITGPRREQLDG
ncbi:MAG: hypothetical protein QOF92_1302, partial [Pseudonocardiales bacterium]|nr:hypothetical protein [Pseudonocardiales bacterium]